MAQYIVLKGGWIAGAPRVADAVIDLSFQAAEYDLKAGKIAPFVASPEPTPEPQVVELAQSANEGDEEPPKSAAPDEGDAQ